MFRKLQQVARLLSQGARLMVGVPEYDNYVAQMARNHPGEPVMSHEAFFRERQEARFGRGKCNTRCC
ncbi:YbdD/YjiX family protein [Pseudomonas sp. GM55]|uniref:YbdD/YjiX family protein n=1 Tax=Pseudomonas sp. GM55 TaxID=1144333 RepID=UPI000270A79C|nr:CstA-like transporter-associated (seleno)protein [Pseudomonas sp. GM55]EJM69054.1 putative small protein [Pseudomonas sp. GM55]